MPRTIKTHELLDLKARLAEHNKRDAKIGYALFSFIAPWFFIKHIMMGIVNILSPSRAKDRKAAFVKHYFKTFFRYRGLPSYVTNQSELDHVGRPMIIFGLRQHIFSSAFAFSSLPFPVVIPIHEVLLKFRTSAYLPFKNIGKLIKHISYPDGTLKENIKNIETLVENKYPVFAHLNEFYINPTDMRTLHIHRSFFKLVRKNYDIRFLTMPDMNAIDHSAFTRTVFVRVDVIKKSDIMLDELTDKEIAKILGKIYDVPQVHIIDD